MLDKGRLLRFLRSCRKPFLVFCTKLTNFHPALILPSSGIGIFETSVRVQARWCLNDMVDEPETWEELIGRLEYTSISHNTLTRLCVLLIPLVLRKCWARQPLACLLLFCLPYNFYWRQRFWHIATAAYPRLIFVCKEFLMKVSCFMLHLWLYFSVVFCFEAKKFWIMSDVSILNFYIFRWNQPLC